MGAKRFWTTTAHLLLALLIVVPSACIAFAMIKIVPNYIKASEDGLIGLNVPDHVQGWMSWAQANLIASIRVAWLLVNYWWLYVPLAAACWVLFEWRVRGESKSLMRLSALSLMALVATGWLGTIAAALVIPYVIALPVQFVQLPEPVVRDHLALVNMSVADMENAVSARDWRASRLYADDALNAIRYLDAMGATAPTLVSLDEQAKIEDAREKITSARESLFQALNATLQENFVSADLALRQFHEAYAQVPGALAAAGPVNRHGEKMKQSAP